MTCLEPCTLWHLIRSDEESCMTLHSLKAADVYIIMCRVDTCRSVCFAYLNQEVRPVTITVHFKVVFIRRNAWMAQATQGISLFLKQLKLLPVCHGAQGQSLDSHSSPTWPLCLHTPVKSVLQWNDLLLVHMQQNIVVHPGDIHHNW